MIKTYMKLIQVQVEMQNRYNEMFRIDQQI